MGSPPWGSGAVRDVGVDPRMRSLRFSIPAVDEPPVPLLTARPRPTTGIDSCGMSHRASPFLLAGALVVLDQLTKAWVVAEIGIGERAASWLGFFHLTHIRNTGAAFGLLRDRGLDLGFATIDGVQLLGLVSLSVALALVVVLVRARHLPALVALALGSLLGGAVGNGVDRLRLGYVTDFIQMQAGWFDFPVFNVADMAIVAGAALLVLSSLVTPHHAR